MEFIILMLNLLNKYFVLIIMKTIFKISFWSILLAFVACSKTEKINIAGNVKGAEGDTIFIQNLQNNELTTVGYKVFDEDEHFKFTLEKSLYPEYYFLKVNDGKQLIIVCDSSNFVTINADVGALNKAKIEGSKVSEQIQKTALLVSDLRADYAIFAVKYKVSDDDEMKNLITEMSDKIQTVKDFIGTEIYKSPRSYYSYFALFQRLDDSNLLFSPYIEDDYKYFAAVATAYNVFRKNDPRTIALYDLVSDALKQQRDDAWKRMIDEAPAGIPDIVMKDTKDVERRLSDYKGKIVILNFWASVNDESRMFNKELLSLYKKYKNRNVVVFQVSADKSKLMWQEAIKQDNLPWVNVCDFKTTVSQAIMLYNVQKLPTTFLIDKDGELNFRANNIVELEGAIKKLL